MQTKLRIELQRVTGHHGFTIPEVLVGLVIFSLGLLLLMSMMVISIRGNSWAEYTTQSSQLISEKIEQIKDNPAAFMQPGSDKLGEYIRSWEVTALTPKLVAVKVKVTRTDANNHTSACSTLTYVQR